MKPLSFLTLPVILFWLLLPPGVCVCKLVTFYASAVCPAVAHVIPANETADFGGKDEHAPWCPAHKMVYFWSTITLLALTLSLLAVVRGSAPAGRAAHDSLIPTRVRPPNTFPSPDIPRHLLLVTLMV